LANFPLSKRIRVKKFKFAGFVNRVLFAVNFTWVKFGPSPAWFYLTGSKAKLILKEKLGYG
jgi:hypothetical protein